MIRETSTVTLRALRPAALSDPAVWRIVAATASAIAERVGVDVLGVDADEDKVRVTLAQPRVAAVGFAAELRRLTEAWHRDKYGGTLWGAHEAE